MGSKYRNGHQFDQRARTLIACRSHLENARSTLEDDFPDICYMIDIVITEVNRQHCTETDIYERRE